MCAVILLMLIVTIKSPVIYYFLLLLNNEQNKPFVLTCFAVDAFYLLSWLCLWCFLAIKHDWIFNVNVPGSTYRPNMTGIVNPPPPRNLFDPYQRDEKTTTIYVNYLWKLILKNVAFSNPALTRQFVAPSAMVWFLLRALNQMTTQVLILTEKWALFATLRPTTGNIFSKLFLTISSVFRETKTVTYSAQTYSPKQKPAVFAQSNGQKPQIITTNITRPLIVGTHEQKPVLWGLQSSRVFQ